MSQDDPYTYLLSFGFPRSQVAKALEIAEGNLLTAKELLDCGALSDVQDEEEEEKEYKLVVLVRGDLGMSAGKVAAQTAHAALGAVAAGDRRVVQQWTNSGEAIIVLNVPSLNDLLSLQSTAVSSRLNTYLVSDAGRTQVQPGSITVCAIGPDEVSKIDRVTRHLRLL